MQSPTKYPKKTRKNTFSQATVTHSEVGDFQGGYFVMPDATSSKENDCPHRTRAHNKTEQRSPARRKQLTNEATSSPHKERVPKYEQDFKKPFADISKDMKKEGVRNELISPSSPTKTTPASPKQQHMDYSDHKYSSKDSLSTSPSSAGRWAGPAFGNAPHPSSLPLPEFPPMSPASSTVSTPSHFTTQDSYLSASPPGHDGAYHGMVYQPHHPLPFPQLSSSPPPSTHLSSIPVVPFPYVGVHQFPAMPPAAPAPSLAQLSTDLRRMLNISAFSDPIMVSANSS